MSSKKARRKERQQKQQEETRRRGKMSPVTLFMLAIGTALVVTALVTTFFVDRGAPPFPGAVWSEAHGHWH